MRASCDVVGQNHTTLLQGIQAVPSQVTTPAGRSSAHGLAQHWRQVSNSDIKSRSEHLRQLLCEPKTPGCQGIAGAWSLPS